MTGFNLPPGCSVRDLPGNRPEDEQAEALWDTIADVLTLNGVNCDTPEAEKIIEGIAELVGKAYGDGYQQGVADIGAAEYHRKQEQEDTEVIVPCVDGTENHKFVVSDENENICYCERCGCHEY